MKIQRLQVEGFRSFFNQANLDLSEVPPGLYHIRGENQVEPELEGNGAGKSSLMEAVFWALAGKTSRNLKAGAVRSWGGKRCACTIEFEEGQLTRSWNPNSLEWKGIVVDQQTLETELGFSPEVMLSVAYFAQFSPFFLDLAPAERMYLYSTVLDLDLWDLKSEQAKEMSKTAEKAAHELEIEHARLETKHSTLMAMDYKGAIAGWEAAQEEKIERALKQAMGCDEEIETLTEEHNALLKTASEAKKKYEEWQKKIASAKEQTKRAQQTYQQEHAQHCVLVTRVVKTTNDLQLFKEKGIGACEACGQKITEEHSKRHLKHLKQIHEEAFEEAANKKITVSLTLAALKIAEDLELKLNKQPQDIHTINAKVAVVEGKLGSLNKSKLSAQLAVNTLKKEKNPFLEQVKQNQIQASSIKKELSGKSGELTEVRNLQKQFEFWIKGFKDVRLQVMQESLIELNAEANECLHQLGLEDWELEFTVEKETKSGTVKRGFLCEVHSPYTDDPVPWEAWSGGESQRLRLAAQLGVANLLASRMGQRFNLEWWDEPTTNLSPQGIKSLLSVLQERAERYGRIILLADHRVLEYPFDGVLNIIKDEQGSHIENGGIQLA